MPCLFRAETSLTHVIVQIAGDAVRMRADVLKEEGTREGPFRRLLIAYQSTFLARSRKRWPATGCNSVQQRCCRWLLMTHNRVGAADEFPITHEFLSQMLGVRRASITEVLQPLQADGLIKGSPIEAG